MPLWTRPVSLATLDAIGVNSASEFFGIRYTAFGKDWIEATIPLDERTRNANGTLHPGALGILAETIGSVAATPVHRYLPSSRPWPNTSHQSSGVDHLRPDTREGISRFDSSGYPRVERIDEGFKWC